ncbi:MAG: imidazole glycerol phosphate synthase subunit HisH [Gemmatimonadota bacterium]|nr:imidazole glycerol phosphate synthase subunit HisH [Gemmatimonadota bacterium]MDE3005511.1 imidazole glycerol phosphate synthase subunit HisH [Gemmatimonadota bacterium]MDE3014266.1 imidazole glycerol phosphate synthase subunit HisH [Gemmatimonadota bacterium]
MIAVVDYGLGNVQAFLHIYKKLNIPARTASVPSDFDHCTGVILPGVGAFDWAMARLNGSEMRQCLESLVVHDEIPVLGVCVGMQMLFDESEEGSLPGLGWVAGRVRQFKASGPLALPYPHMGWNEAVPKKEGGLFRGMEGSSRFYFLHSYYVEASRSSDVLAETSYGIDFASAVQAGHIFGTQFHPEKSHDWGTRLLKNFAELRSCSVPE